MIKEKKPFILKGSNSLFYKYKSSDKEITVYLKEGKEFTGKIRFYDEFAIKIILSDGSITIPIHNILYYRCDYFLMDNEEGLERVFRGLARSTERESQQLLKYKKNKNLLHFCLEDGIEVTGWLQWYLDHVYCIKPRGEKLDYFIHKRHILYYRKLED